MNAESRKAVLPFLRGLPCNPSTSIIPSVRTSLEKDCIRPEIQKIYACSDRVAWASSVHCVKSISFLHEAHTWDFSNSSENISFSAPQLGHLHVNDFRFLN
jgi:hypothetical protein